MEVLSMKERIFHLDLTGEQSAEYAIVPGDPGRVPKIAAYLDNPVKLAQNREFTTYIGELCGKNVFVTSTGIGGPSAAIALEELAALGVKTIIRVGTCGGMQLDIEGGDLIIPTGAIRMDGTSKEYLPIEFPAVPSFEVLSALHESAKRQNLRCHTGVVQSKDSFYGQHEPARMPVGPELEYKWQAWIKAGALASEMECSTLFTVASCLNIKAGAILLAIWNQERVRAGLPNPESLETDAAIRVTIDALKILITGE
jgi:uridine phosphorylase